MPRKFYLTERKYFYRSSRCQGGDLTCYCRTRPVDAPRVLPGFRDDPAAPTAGGQKGNHMVEREECPHSRKIKGSILR